MKAVQKTFSVLSVVFFGLLGFFWAMMGLAAVIAQTGGVWSVLVGMGFLAFGSLSIMTAVRILRKGWVGESHIMFLVVGAVNALWWTVVGLVPFLLEFFKLMTPLPEDVETPTGPFAVLAIASIFFLVFLIISEKEKWNE